MGWSYVHDATKPVNPPSLPSLDHIPLSQRLKLSIPNSADSPTPIPQNDRRLTTPFTPKPSHDAVVKREHADCDSKVICPVIQIDASGRARFKHVQPSDFPALKVKKEVPEGVVDDDDLDHVVLKERQRMLLARKFPELSNPAVEGCREGLSENIMDHADEKVNEVISSVDEKPTVAIDQCQGTLDGRNTSLVELPLGATSGLSLSTDHASPKSTESVIPACLQEHDHMFKFRGINMQIDSHEEHMPTNNDGPSSSTCPTSVKIKDEPRDYSEIHNFMKDVMGSISINLPDVKSEREVHNECDDDQVEHMSLVDRLNFRMAGEDLNISTIYKSLKKTKPSSFVSSSSPSESAEPSRIKCSRKRKKTATDSVQTALEEDAPGLLQVLLDKGVIVDEIKLYGETGNDEALDESFCEDNFSELEAVITKIFSQRHSFMKFPVIRGAKVSRASYCLACLISLVEQTRYLKFRKWPAEWGWCRDLQSFIFVFERHNRIVLERPEYGYATYFFELVESLPVEWQIKRLVIAMKLTSCSRISLIENKELVVGEDLAEGEAKVLMEYGWTPNSGLGTMLHYRDRVVHDRKHEDTSEWRTKIAKLLMDGFNGGTIVTPNIPKKVAEYRCSSS